MGVLHLPEVLPGFAGFPSAVQRSGDDHLPASRRIVPGSGMGACRSAAGLDAGIHLWFEMALAGATNPLGTAFLVEVLLGLMGIIGTVNGRTAVAGFNSFDALSLLGVIAIVIVGMAIGWAIYNYQIKNIEYNELHIRRIVLDFHRHAGSCDYLLIFFFLRALLLLGGFFGQYLVKRKSGAEIREQMNTLTLDNIDTLGDRLPKNKQAVIVSYMKKLVDNRQSKAQVNRILDQYAQFVEKDLSLPSTLLKMGPMLGLMGTLIPMGPALVGLSTGDIASMAYNMQVAFATTVVGLFSAAIGFVTKQTKNRWYTEDMSNLEFMADLLEEK